MAESSASSSFSRGSNIGVIGAGRLGSSLAIALDRADYSVVAVSSRRPEHREWLQSKLPEVSFVAEPQKVADLAQIVFVSTSDSAIRVAADAVEWRTGQAVIHCSGAASLNELQRPASMGATVGGFHPLQTFPTPDSADLLAGISFGIESVDPGLNRWLVELASNLGGNAIHVTSEQRAAYHTAAVMACGLLVGLTGLAAEVWAETGAVSRAEAIDALTPLVKTTANSIGVNGLPGALTGPYVRGDVKTVEAHLEATVGVSSEIGAAYSALALAALHIAKEQGGLTDKAAQGIKEMLISQLRSNCEKIE